MSHVIFIGNPGYERLDYYSKPNLFKRLSSHVKETGADLPRRIALSFVPPFVNKSAKKVHVDFVGPALALITISLLLHCGHAGKLPESAIRLMPSVTLILYCIFTPLICYVITCLGGATFSLVDLSALLGYGLYGHLLTILTSFIFDDSSSNFIFFVCLIIFGGLSSLRIVLVLLVTIPKPAARLIVCSFITIVHLLFLIFVHFSYMHQTFSYGKSELLDY